MKYLTIILLFCFSCQQAKSQSIDNQEVKLLAANTLFGGMTTGFGALINKKKDEKAFPAFFRGFKYGCLGGALLYVGKKQSNLIHQGNTVAGAWGGKLVHNAGASIMENVAVGRAPFSHYNLYVGFMRLELDWQERFKAQPKFMPASFLVFMYHVSVIKGRFDVGRSLKMGAPYFVINEPAAGYAGSMAKGTAIRNDHYRGAYWGANSKFYSGEQYVDLIDAHENVHGLQFQESFIFNTYAYKPASRLRNKSKVIMGLSKYIYFDFNIMDFTSILGMAYANKKGGYFYSPYEFEAERMAINRYFDVKNDRR